MTPDRRPQILVACAISLTLAARVPLEAQAAAGAAPLHIVVLAGDDSVNIIQQRTAVAPIVEVRDKNDQPVAGALVLFALGDRSTFANGQKTFSVATNASGRAVSDQVVPVRSGNAQISVKATLNGQTATRSIRQLNVQTAADAATVVSRSGAAAAAGGGLSPLALGAIVGGGGAAAIVGIRAASSDEADATTSPTPPSNQPTLPAVMNGPFATTEVFVVTPPGCSISIPFTGTVSITIQSQSATTLSGVGSFVRTLGDPSPASCGGFAPSAGNTATVALGSFSGPPSNIQMTMSSTASNGISSATNLATFSGQVVGSEIQGTLTYAVTTTILASGQQIANSVTVGVTLR